MAASHYSYSMSTKIEMVVFLATIFSLQYLTVFCFEYQVGGNNGWVVPPPNDTKVYNDWASENRFKVGDIILFRYKKDSVMEVTKEDYMKCNSSHPNYFSNIGNSLYRLENSGAFYFISGVSGHCEEGQKMIIKVMSEFQDSSSSSSSPSGGGGDSNSAGSVVAVLSKLVFVVLCSFASYLF